MADRFIGYQRSIIFGGILMTLGHFILALPDAWSFFYGMAFIICGNGFFKPNVSSLVRTLYTENDPRRDSGFSIIYSASRTPKMYIKIGFTVSTPTSA